MSLRFEDGRALRVFPDWKTSNAIGVAYAFEQYGVEDNALCYEMRIELTQVKLAIQKERHGEGMEGNKRMKEKIRAALNDHAYKRLLPWLNQKGIQAVLYTNDV
ncbi:MAG: hypothetical protein ACXWIN_10255 [Burkholderiaceae bacterium]